MSNLMKELSIEIYNNYEFEKSFGNVQRLFQRIKLYQDTENFYENEFILSVISDLLEYVQFQYFSVEKEEEEYLVLSLKQKAMFWYYTRINMAISNVKSLMSFNINSYALNEQAFEEYKNVCVRVSWILDRIQNVINESNGFLVAMENAKDAYHSYIVKLSDDTNI